MLCNSKFLNLCIQGKDMLIRDSWFNSHLSSTTMVHLEGSCGQTISNIHVHSGIYPNLSLLRSGLPFSCKEIATSICKDIKKQEQTSDVLVRHWSHLKPFYVHVDSQSQIIIWHQWNGRKVSLNVYSSPFLAPPSVPNNLFLSLFYIELMIQS